jgi:hypothetical protein
MRIFMPLGAAFVLLIFTGVAHGADEELHRVTNAKAAAHASLSARADVPDEPPRLPDRAAQPPGKVVPDAALKRKGDVVDRAKDQARKAASDEARAVRADVANRSAQGTAASAAKSANADDHAAAGQARARAARAGKPDHPNMPDNPGQGPKK